jgi:[ribosomal protein S18]-alanine N-acetyltransferase
MIRRARQADISALAALEDVFPTDRMSRRNFADMLRRGTASVLIYEAGGELQGDAVVLYRRNSPIARIYSLVVHPAQRGRGIAQELLAAVESDARTRQCSSLSLEVRPDNAQALRLYSRLGYAVTQRLEHFYEDGSPALRLGKSLIT